MNVFKTDYHKDNRGLGSVPHRNTGHNNQRMGRPGVNTHRNMKVPSGTENGSSEWCHRRTTFGSTKNLSNQGSLKNHFLKEFFKEPIKVFQRTFKKWFFKAPFLVPQRTFQTRVL